MRTFRDAKLMAKVLRAEMPELTHSQTLEIVAKQFGFDNWNILAAKIDEARQSRIIPAYEVSGLDVTDPRRATTSTIPILRIFAEKKALEFYVEFLGFALDWGGPSAGPGTSFYGQVIRAATTFQLSEMPYDPGAGATISISLGDLDALHEELRQKYGEMGSRIWGTAVWVPQIQEVPWGARILTISDPFANHLRFFEPVDADAREGLPRWVR